MWKWRINQLFFVSNLFLYIKSMDFLKNRLSINVKTLEYVIRWKIIFVKVFTENGACFIIIS